MAPGRPSPPFAGEDPARVARDRADSTSASRPRNWIRCETFADRDVARIRLAIAAAVFADAHSVAESSRDVSDPTSGPRTLTPGSVTGSLTSRLRV